MGLAVVATLTVTNRQPRAGKVVSLRPQLKGLQRLLRGLADVTPMPVERISAALESAQDLDDLASGRG